MNLSPQTLILFSLAFDVILGLVVVFLWLRQRDEWHALFWAIGQASITAGTAVWFLGPADLPKLGLSALTLTFSVAGFLCGTERFLGTLRRRHLRPALLAFSLFGLAVYAIWTSQPAWVAKGTAWALGLTILWAGLRLAGSRHHYRVLGVVLCLRGAFNIANACGLVPPDFQAWLLFSVVLKSASMLCIIYAMQGKLQQRYARTIDSLSSAFLILNRGGYLRVINERGAALLGVAGAEALVGSHLASHLPGATAESVAAYFDRFAAAAPRYPYVETRNVALRDGRRLPLQLIASPDVEHGQLHCMVQVIDLSDSRKKDAQLDRAARYDAITGQLNRHGLAQALHTVLRQARDSGVACAVLFIDVDRFKRVNDAFGHQAGDQLLSQLAARLRALLRDGDLLARFGDDEFVIVLPALPAGSAARLVATLGAQVRRALLPGFALSQLKVTVSASIGVACYPEHGRDGATLIRNADIAMHAAKRGGGGGALHHFDAAMNADSTEALALDSALRGAIAADELRLVYQPIMDARSGELRKVEALLRWHSAKLGTVAPDRFIAVAEDSDLIITLGTWVLQQACRQLAQWRDLARPLTVSVNISARQLADPAFVGLVEQALASHGLAARQLELELTERVLIDDAASVRITLARLSALGVSIALDDFGTGYSSLSYLTQFHINTLKIDRAFIRDIEHSDRSMSLVAAIIAMGQALGMSVVAEGVETAHQANTLERMGCHYLQGYHLGKPLPPEQLDLAASLA